MKRHNFISLISVIFILLAAGCTPALWTAAKEGNIADINKLLEKGANINERTGGYEGTALMIAAEKGQTEAVKLLIEKGANVNEKDGSNVTPLMYAALYDHANIAKILIENGADIDYAITKFKSENWGTVGANGLKILEKLAKKQEIASQPVIAAPKPSQEVSPTIKSDVDELPAIKAKPNKNAYAIVIGIENYRQKLPKADYATHDAQTVAEYLTKVMGYPEENVVTLLNDHASNVDLVKYFEKWLPNNVENGGSVFVYYSGHGAPDPKSGSAYLVPYDGDPSFIDETGYSLKRMYAALGKLPAKEIIVALDSCFSGAGGRSVIAKGARPLVMNLQNAVALPSNMTVLSASSGEQISSTYDEKGHGLFTYFMLKAIKNEDVVRQDSSIKIDDLFGYLKPQVERIARKQYNNEQTPQLIEPEKKKVFLRE